MNVDSLNSLANSENIGKEFKFIIGGLKEIRDNIVELNKYEVLGKTKISLKEVNDATTKLNTTLVENDKINKNLNATLIQQENLRRKKAQADAAEAVAEKKIIDLIQKEEQARRKNAAAMEVENQKQKATVYPSSDRFKDRPVSAIPFEVKNGNSPVASAESISAMQALNNEEVKQIALTNAYYESQERVNDQSNNTADLLNKEARQTALLNAQREAETKTIAKAKSQNKELIVLRDNVNTSTAGSARRIGVYNQMIDANNKYIDLNSDKLAKQKINIGNYADGVEKGSRKIGSGVSAIYSKVRILANILPGIGIAGLFGLAFNGVATLVSGVINAFSGGERKISAFVQQQKTLAEFSEKASTSLGNEYGKLELVRQKLNDLNIPVAERVKLAKEYNKTAEKTNQIDTEQIGNLALVNESISKQIELIKKRAFATAAEQIITEKAGALLLAQEKARQKNLEFSIQATAPIEGVSDTQYINVGGRLMKYTPGKESLVTEQVAKQKRFLAERISKDPSVKKAEQELASALNIGSQFVDIESLFDKPKKELAAKTPRDSMADFAKNESEKRKALFEIFKKRLEDRIAANEQLLAEDKKSFDERLAEANLSYGNFVNADKKLFDTRLMAAQEYYDKSLELIRAQTKFDKGELDEQETEAKRRANFQIKDKKQLGVVLQSITDEFNAKRKLTDVKENSEILKLDAVSEKQFTELAKKSFQERAKAKEEIEKTNLEHSKSIHEQELTDIQNNYDKDLLSLNKKFEEKRITEEKYNKKRLRLQLAYQLDLLEADIKFTKETITLAEARAELETDPAKKLAALDAIASARQKLAKLETDLQKAVFEYGKTTSKVTLEELEKIFAKVQKVATDVFGIISGFIDARADKEKNAIQAEIDLLEKKKQKDIEVANQTITNATERANVITAIEATAAAKREALETKQRQADERRARFEKAATIARIIIETASAVVHQLATGTVFSAIAAGVLGAAQLAVAIATPIPKYRQGTPKEGHAGGLMYVGDGGLSEAVVLPDGSTYKTPATSTLVDAPKGTTVIDDFRKIGLNDAPTVRVVVPMNDQKALEKVGANIVMAIKQKREYHIQGMPRHREYLKDGHTFRKYLNSRL